MFAAVPSDGAPFEAALCLGSASGPARGSAMRGARAASAAACPHSSGGGKARCTAYTAPSARVGRFRRREADNQRSRVVAPRRGGGNGRPPVAFCLGSASTTRVVSAALSQPHPPTEKTAGASVSSALMSWSCHPAEVAKRAARARRRPLPHATRHLCSDPSISCCCCFKALQLSPKLLSLCKEEVCDI